MLSMSLMNGLSGPNPEFGLPDHGRVMHYFALCPGVRIRGSAEGKAMVDVFDDQAGEGHVTGSKKKYFSFSDENY